MGAEGGAEGEGDEGGNGHGASQGDGEFPEENSGGAALEGDGEKNDHQTCGDGEDGPGDFFHGKQTGFEGGHALLNVADDVFEDDDRVIDHDADGQHQGQQGKDVDAITEEVEQPEGSQNRDGDRRGGNHRGAGVPQKEKDQKDHENRGNPDGLGHFADGGFDVERGVVGKIEADIRWKQGADAGDFRTDAAGDVDGVSVGLFNHAQPHRRLPVEARDGVLDLRADLHGGDVAQANRRTVHLPDNQVSILLRFVHPPTGHDAEGTFLPLNAAGGELDVFLLQQGPDIRGGDLAGGHPGRVQPDAHGGAFLAAEVDAPDPGHHLKPVPDLAFRQVGEFEGGAAFAEEGDPHDLLGVGVLLGDDGFLDVVGQLVADATDPVADVLGADVDAVVQLKLDGDDADLLAGFAAEDLDARDIVDFLLERFGDIGLDECGIGPGIHGGDGDNRRIDVGKLADGQPGKGDDSDESQGQVEHQGGDGPPDAEFRKIHGEAGWGNSLRPGERRRLPERATRSPALRPLRISTRPGIRRPVCTGTSSATPPASR